MNWRNWLLMVAGFGLMISMIDVSCLSVKYVQVTEASCLPSFDTSQLLNRQDPFQLEKL